MITPKPLFTSMTVPTLDNLAGTYHLSDVTVKVGDGPEQSIMHLFGANGHTGRLIQLNADSTLCYLSKRRRNICKRQQEGRWRLLSRNRICIDGDTGTITRYDGRQLQITSEEDSGFETRITATYIRTAAAS